MIDVGVFVGLCVSEFRLSVSCVSDVMVGVDVEGVVVM